MSAVLTDKHPKTLAQPQPSDPKMRIAIVGCGPRGLQCLEALTRHVSSEDLATLAITVFEPAEKPGAGRIYDPRQPHVLKMNFATEYIDFWKADDSPTRRSDSLIGWLAERYPSLTQTDEFVPRAIVGEYLHECFCTVSQRLGKHAKLDVVRSTAKSISRTHDGWQICDGDLVRKFDYVVLTTGHEGLRVSSALPAVDNEVFVFPVEKNLSIENIPPAASVLVRGFGLTAIDAVLTLTEGRGGSFDTSSPLPRYHRSHQEPSQIHIRCRSGRPMLAKPTAQVEPVTDCFWDPYRERLQALQSRHGSLHWRGDIWPVLMDATADLLSRSGSATHARDIDHWYRGWSLYKMDAAAARQAMLQSYAVATGQRAKDIPFMLGETWRRLYPDLVPLVGQGGMAADQWTCFHRVGCEMERIAFGPPAASVGKLLRLIREQIVTLGISGTNSVQYDAVINAVIAPPHQTNQEGPVSQLVQAGQMQTDRASGAVKVDDSGRPLGNAKGLAIFGRPTEGWVVGNDTLSRTLHQQIENWARTLLVRSDAG